jgi:hypothetical protein
MKFQGLQKRRGGELSIEVQGDYCANTVYGNRDARERGCDWLEMSDKVNDGPRVRGVETKLEIFQMTY